MDTTKRSGLARGLEQGEQLLGMMITMPDPKLVEVAGLVGFDLVVLDTEHGPGDHLSLGQHIVAARSVGLQVLVRVGHPAEILRALDLGANGIIAPHVSTVEAAQEVVRAASYPPLGERGFASSTRAGSYGLVSPEEHVATSERDTVVIVMIEDATAVASVRDIAAVPGLSGLFVGPADLASSLGRPGRVTDPDVRAAIEQVHDAAHTAGLGAVSIVNDVPTAVAHFAAGSDVVVYNSQAAVLAMAKDLLAARPDAT